MSFDGEIFASKRAELTRPSPSVRASVNELRFSCDGPFAVGVVPWQRRPGETVFTVVVKATYALEPELCPLLEEPEALQEEDGFWDDDSDRSLYAPSDLVLWKPISEVIVLGHAYAPDQHPSHSIATRVAVGSVDKVVEAWPQRRVDREGRWESGKAMARLPLHYEAAAGGPGTDNPVGIDPTELGEGGRRRIPGVLPPNLDVRPGEHIATVGFGPIAPHWPPRAKLLRPQDRAWLRDPRARPMPIGFDPRYFCVAPVDQRADEPFRVDERIILEGLSPQHPRLVTNLAGVSPRIVFTEGKGLEAPVLSADLLRIDTDRGVATLTFRAQIAFEGVVPAVAILVSMGPEQASPSRVVYPLPKLQEEPTSDLPALGTMGRRAQPVVAGAAIGPASAGPPRHPDAMEMTHVENTADLPGGPALPFAPRAPDPRERTQSHPDGALPFYSPDADEPTNAPPEGRVDEAAFAARSARTSSPSIPSTAPSVRSVVPLPAPSVPSRPPPTVAPPSSRSALPPSPLPSLRAQSGSALPAPPTMGAPLTTLEAAPPPPAARPSTLGERMGSSGSLTSHDPLRPAPPPPGNVAPPAPPSRGASDISESKPEPSKNRDPFQVTIGRQASPAPSSLEVRPRNLPFDSAKDASDAAIRGERRPQEPEPRDRRVEAPGGGPTRRRALVDLLCFEPSLNRRLRRSRVHAETLTDFNPPRVPRRPDEPDADREREERTRLEVLRVLSCGAPIDTADLGQAVDRHLEDANDLEMPLFLIAGELRPTFDEVEALRAALGVAQPLLGSDKRVQAAVSVAEGALASTTPPLRQTALALYRQLETAVQQLSLGPRYLAEQVEHSLLTQRRYRKPTILGEPRIRAEIGSGYPVYLPESVGLRLPMLTSFQVVALVELHPKEDASETSPDALLVTALGRVVRAARSR